MAARAPNLLNLAVELGFVLFAGALGWFGAPIWTVAALAAAMIAYWMWNRRTGLKQLAAAGIAKLTATAAISIAMVGAFLAGAYFMGRVFSGGYQ